MSARVKAKIIRTGGSLAIIIPAQIRRASGLEASQAVEVEATADGFVVRPSRDYQRYTIKQLLSRSTAKGLRAGADDHPFLDAPATGAEAW